MEESNQKTISFPILQCRVGPMLSSVFWNANTYLSEIFYFNISESQTYSKYYQCQANMSNLSPWYIPPSDSVQTCKPMQMTTPRSSTCCIDVSLIYPKNYFKKCFIPLR